MTNDQNPSKGRTKPGDKPDDQNRDDSRNFANVQGQGNGSNVVNNLLNAPAALTFPVCVALATALWTVLKAFGGWANASYVGVVSCIVIGVCLFLIDVLYTQPGQQTPLTTQTYVIRGIFAFFNILLLAVAVVQVTEPAVSG